MFGCTLGHNIRPTTREVFEKTGHNFECRRCEQTFKSGGDFEISVKDMIVGILKK